MTAEELERVLARLTRMAEAADERMKSLADRVGAVRSLVEQLAGAAGKGVASESETEDKAARKGTTEPDQAQVEVVFK